ncbi:MAG: hypothetical protein COA79_08535 [Planctomycetota bacterium]|nr:MAG: hypothetical protein COA79_08535 [Planctomycetota bacterium]
MQRNVIILCFIIYLISSNCFSDDKFDSKQYVENIFEEHPSLAIDLINKNIIKQNLLKINNTQRTDYLYSINKHQLSYKGRELLLKGLPVVYLPKSKLPIDSTKYYKRRSKTARMIYKWEFDIPAAGEYLIHQTSSPYTKGYLNKSSVLNIGHGTFSLQFSGRKYIKLQAGANRLELIKEINKNIKLNILSKADVNKVKEIVLKHLSSNGDADIKWVLNNLLPHIASKQHGSAVFINKLLGSDVYKVYLKKNSEKIIQHIKNYIKLTANFYDGYLIGKQFYSNHPTIFIKGLMTSDEPLIKNFPYYKIFLYQATCDNNYKTIFNVIDETLQYQKSKLSEKKLLENTINYYQYLMSPFNYYGHSKSLPLLTKKIKEATDLAKTKGIELKSLKILPDSRASDLIISDATEKSQALNTQSLILDYKNEPNILKRCFDILTTLKHSIIKNQTNFFSIRFVFIQAAYKNKLFLRDFKKYSHDKISKRLNKLIQNKDFSELHKILSQFSMILELPNIHQALGDHYFKIGIYDKSYFHLSRAVKIKPNASPNVLAKLYLLEDSSEILPQFRNKLNESKNKSVNLKGSPITLKKLKASLKNNITFKSNFPGKLIKRLTLPNDHSQYWNHPIKLTHQGVEPMFTATKMFLSTSNSILAYSLNDGKPLWKNIGSNEYYNHLEPGPHQKRFVLGKGGPNIYHFSTIDYSGYKTFTSYKLNGEFNWDIATFKEAQSLEPISAPIANGGSLVFLSYDDKQTIKSLSLNIMNSLNGKIETSIPLAIIPIDFRGLKFWNTYRHDQHFVKDDQFIYGYTGTGIIFKVDTIAKQLLWGQSYIKRKAPHYFDREFHNLFGYAPSGYIRVFNNTLVSYMPDNQTFMGTNKVSGKEIWRAGHLKPMHIHGRHTKKFIYYSEYLQHQTPKLVKIDPETGETIWRKSTNGLIPQGEGEVSEKLIIIPCLKSIAIFDKKTGAFIKKINLNLQPLKVVYGNNRWVILTKKDAFLLDNSGDLNSTELNQSPVKETGFVKPETKDIPLPYDSITLEKALSIPETAYTSDKFDAQLIPTSLPRHHILKRDQHITLFREGFEQSTGIYIQPSILWYSQIPYNCLLKDKIIISEPGEVRAEDLFTRKVLWTYLYQAETPLVKHTLKKKRLVIASNSKFTAFQTPFGTIRVLASNNQNHLFDLNLENAIDMKILGPYLMILHGKEIKTYDLNQRGKFLWEKTNSHGFTIAKEGKYFVCISRGSHLGNGTEYNDPKTGKKISRFQFGRGHMDGQYTRIFGDKYSIAYNYLFDTKTGKRVKEYQEARAVKKGGYLCFFKKGGKEGHYIEGTKKYPIKFTGRGDSRNCQIASLKIGNKIIVMSIYSIETFEITGDKLRQIDYTTIMAAHYGNRDSTSFFALDNSLLEIRRNQMYFFRQFDPHNNYNKIKSFRVSNKLQSAFPYGELYPEIKINADQWLPNNDSKPTREITYQAFANHKKSFLHFKLSPLKNKNEKTILHVASNHQGLSVIFKWNPDLWDHCTSSFHVKDSINSWKELDQDGNIHLYITMPLEGLNKRFKQTLPDFAIEFRQYKNNIETGLFRVGGTFYLFPSRSRHDHEKLIGWDNYVNDEAQKIKDYKLRSIIYQSNEGFFPQGLEFQKWVIDSRRFKTIEENIANIKRLAKKNAKNFCIINILPVLLKEELHLFKMKNKNILEINPKYYEHLIFSLKKIVTFANSIGVKKQWLNFALTFHTLEVFPAKEVVNYSRHLYYKSIHGHYIYGHKTAFIDTYFEYTDNPAIQDTNKPYLQYFFPSLLTGYPTQKEITNIGLIKVMMRNTCLGQLNLFKPNGKTQLWSRDFSTIDPTMMTKNKKPLKTKQKIYLFDSKSFKCFSAIGRRPIENINIHIPKIQVPIVIKDKGLEYENIIATLRNLPSDSQLGTYIMQTITSKQPNMQSEDLLKLFELWLLRINQNEKAFLKASKYIFKYLIKINKSGIKVYKDLFKAAKIPTSYQRYFLMSYFFNVNGKSTFSAMGPIDSELTEKPYEKFSKGKKYSNGKKDFLFGKMPSKTKKSKTNTYYIAMNIESKKRKSAYFYSLNTDRKASPLLSVWLNKKATIEGISFKNVSHNLIYKKISLKKGSNILILKIEDLREFRRFSINIGDSKGYPIKGITIKNIHD